MLNSERMQRVQDHINSFAQYGATTNGITRLAFSLADIEARRFLCREMEKLGLKVSVDRFGNIIGCRDGRYNWLEPVVIGSHLDTVPEGGKFDGVVGIVAGLEIIRYLNEHGIVADKPIWLVCFCCEESARFGNGTMGVKYMVGSVTDNILKSLVDKDNKCLYDEMISAKIEGPAFLSPVKPGGIFGYLELHIEQAERLVRARCPIGIVTAIAAPTRFNVTVSGEANHSGTTPMDGRKDAGLGFSYMNKRLNKICLNECKKGNAIVGTIGYASFIEGSMNKIPGTVVFPVDIRGIDYNTKTKVVNRIKKEFRRIAKERELQVKFEDITDEKPVIFTQEIIEKLCTIADKNEIPYIKMHSGAGHDAMHMPEISQYTGMVFVRNYNGSHKPDEYADIKDIMEGIRVLYAAVLQLAA